MIINGYETAAYWVVTGNFDQERLEIFLYGHTEVKFVAEAETYDIAVLRTTILCCDPIISINRIQEQAKRLSWAGIVWTQRNVYESLQQASEEFTRMAKV